VDIPAAIASIKHHPSWVTLLCRWKSTSSVGKWRRGWVGGLLVVGLVFLVLPSQSQTPQSDTIESTSNPLPPLRVAARLVRPDVFKDNGQLVGFSVDIGRKILEQLQRSAIIQTYPDATAVLGAIQSGQADLGISAIAITSQRDALFDFSYPILLGDLGIMVREPERQHRPIEQEVLRRLSNPNLRRLVILIAVLMLMPAHIVWYFERNCNDGLVDDPAYLPGIFQALWWTILALLGQANQMPVEPVSKAIGLFWVIVGIIFVAYFTADITAELTIQELQGRIQGLSDLQNRPVATFVDEEALDHVYQRNLQQIKPFLKSEDAYQALISGEVDAFIAPTPLLRYYVFRSGTERVMILNESFLPRFYAIAIPKDSPYRNPINRAILKLKEDGTYNQIYRKWFGINP
jgi:polar amino acid transport system substrate-binding protein